MSVIFCVLRNFNNPYLTANMNDIAAPLPLRRSDIPLEEAFYNGKTPSCVVIGRSSNAYPIGVKNDLDLSEKAGRSHFTKTLVDFVLAL